MVRYCLKIETNLQKITVENESITVEVTVRDEEDAGPSYGDDDDEPPLPPTPPAKNYAAKGVVTARDIAGKKDVAEGAAVCIFGESGAATVVARATVKGKYKATLSAGKTYHIEVSHTDEEGYSYLGSRESFTLTADCSELNIEMKPVPVVSLTVADTDGRCENRKNGWRSRTTGRLCMDRRQWQGDHVPS